MNIKNIVMPKQKVKIVKLTDFSFPPEVFIPLKCGKFIDKFISRKGGTMPGTITVVVGEPGSGKTTLLIDKMCGVETTNENKDCLYISSEMNPIDNMELSEELPQLMGLNTLYLSDYKNPKLAMEEALDMGWDYVILDSFADTKDKVKDSDSCRISATAVETWLISLLVKNAKGKNKKKKYTAFDVIQHYTKGGTYAGSTKIKHNTTGMMFVLIDEQTNERYIIYTKNRRGDVRKRLYMELKDGELTYNERKYNDLEKAIKIQKEMDDYNIDSEDKLIDLLRVKKEEDTKETLGESEDTIDIDTIKLVNDINQKEKIENVES
jgi:predicted ATP-dependent serine protease